jgi:hypothetical protein
MTALLFGITAFAACGDESSSFEDQMGSLLFEQARLAQEFDDLLDPLFQEMTATGNMLVAAGSFSQRLDEIRDTHQRFVTIAEEWEALDPPEEAQTFHLLALLMINLRAESLGGLVAAGEAAARFGQLDPVSLSEAGTQWAAALELWPEVLADANSFNAGDLDD